jgi:serine/threonine protein kinase/Tol biopolymer transport system component
MALEVGSLLYNRYKIENVLARGGMGAIYRAIDESLGVAVAIKENLFSTDEASRQFRREATILASLRHPNLPRVTDHFVIPNQGQYLVMDFIEGEDLRHLVNTKGVFTEEEVVLIGTSICTALTYLHNRQPPIVHRDIKPGNIKITPNQQAFLVDFGLAKESHAGQATTTGAQALTPGYAPPEQYGQGTDPRSDIYALAATLYSGLTGKTPEDGLARAMKSAELTPLTSHNPNISERIAKVITHAMEVAPKNRFQTADDFRTALLEVNTAARQHQEQEEAHTTRLQVGSAIKPGTPPHAVASQPRAGIPSQPVSQPRSQPQVVIPMTPSSPVARKFPWAVVMGIGLVLVIMVALAAALVMGNIFGPKALSQTTTTQSAEPTDTSVPPTNTREAAATETLAIIVEKATATVTVTDAPTLTPTLNSTPTGGGKGKIAFVSNRSGIPQIWMMNNDGTDQIQVTNLSDGACQPTWAPDGSRLIITSPCRKREDIYKGSALFFINTDGTGLMPLPSVPGGDFEAAWSPDGKKVAFTSIRENIPHIFILDLDTRLVTRLSHSSSTDRRPTWSPDGKSIVFESPRLGKLSIWVMDTLGVKAYEYSLSENGVSQMPDWSPDGTIIVYSQGGGLPWLIAKQFGSRQTPEVRFSNARPAFDPDISPDGFWVAFEGYDVTNKDIFIVTMTGSNVTRLTTDAGDDFQAVWQPAPANP